MTSLLSILLVVGSGWLLLKGMTKLADWLEDNGYLVYHGKTFDQMGEKEVEAMIARAIRNAKQGK